MLKFLILLLISLSLLVLNGDSKVSTPANSSDSIRQESKELTDSIQVDTVKIAEQDEWETVIEKTGASWYGVPYHGRKTASGVIYNQWGYSFARQVKLSKIFKFGEEYKVTNLANGRSVIVVCNDTGPLQPGVKIDLSKQAMLDLDGIYVGKIKVKIEKRIKQNR